VTIYYCDTSAVARALLPAEPGHARAQSLVMSPDNVIVTSEWTMVELASVRARRLDGKPAAQAAMRAELDRVIDRHIWLLTCDQGLLLDRTQALIAQHRLRTMDALHLAVAELVARPLAQPRDVEFATADLQQAAAANRLHFRSDALVD
jgi:uncharacterized protein